MKRPTAIQNPALSRKCCGQISNVRLKMEFPSQDSAVLQCPAILQMTNVSFLLWGIRGRFTGRPLSLNIMCDVLISYDGLGLHYEYHVCLSSQRLFKCISQLKPGLFCTPTLAPTHFLVATEELSRLHQMLPYAGMVILLPLGSY